MDLDTLESPFHWHGRYRVWFLSTTDLLTEGGDTTLDVERAITDANAHPLYLMTYDGRIYNWNTIIAIKKV